MAEGHRLGGLQVGEAGHDCGCVIDCLLRHHLLQARQLLVEHVKAITHVKAEVGCHLIIARTRRMQPSGGFADHVPERRLDVHVNVFERGGEGEITCVNGLSDRLEPLHNFANVGFCQDAAFAQHLRMCY
jgi:hypothetical protein